MKSTPPTQPATAGFFCIYYTTPSNNSLFTSFLSLTKYIKYVILYTSLTEPVPLAIRPSDCSFLEKNVDIDETIKKVWNLLKGVATIFLMVLITMNIWNYLMPSLFGLKEITFWQAFWMEALLALQLMFVGCLFGLIMSLTRK